MHSTFTLLSILRYSAAKAWSDMWRMYSPLSWTFGWMSRVVMQVVFFAVIGILLDSPDAIRYLFIGGAVMITATEALNSVASITWERWQGTMPLLVAAPSRMWPVFVSGSVQWVPSGVLTSSVGLFAIAPIFGVAWTPGRAMAAFACLIVAAITTYFFAMFLGALALAATSIRSLISNVAQIGMMLVCGVVVPISYWPGILQNLGRALPLTHALAAVRDIADPPVGVSLTARVGTGVGLATLVGLGWLLAAALLLERLAAFGRRSGSIDFAD